MPDHIKVLVDLFAQGFWFWLPVVVPVIQELLIEGGTLYCHSLSSNLRRMCFHISLWNQVSYNQQHVSLIGSLLRGASYSERWLEFPETHS